MAFLGLALVLLSLYIFSYIKKLNTLAIISNSMLMPCIGLSAVLYLVNFFPDSVNIATFTALSFIFASISVILFNFEKKVPCRIFACLLFMLSQAIWLKFYFSTFFMYRIPAFAIILTAALFFAILIAIFIILGKKNPVFYFGSVAIFFETTSLLFCAIITLCFCKNLYSAILTAATTLTEILTVHYILQTAKFNFKHSNFINLILYLIAQLMTAAAGILMFKFA